MPRYSYSSRDTADSCKKIETLFLKKNGYFLTGGRFGGTLNWSSNGEPTGSISISSTISEQEKYVRLWYKITKRDTGEKRDIDYRVYLTTTPCHFGGARYWFICPLYRNGRYCGRRVGVLYHGNGDYFGCRHCYDLTYQSRNSSQRFRSLSHFFDADEKLVEWEQKYKDKYLYYGGRPTRRYKKLEKLGRKMGNSAALINLQKML